MEYEEKKGKISCSFCFSLPIGSFFPLERSDNGFGISKENINRIL